MAGFRTETKMLSVKEENKKDNKTKGKWQNQLTIEIYTRSWWHFANNHGSNHNCMLGDVAGGAGVRRTRD